MTNPEKRIYTLMRLVVWHLHNGKCYLSGRELAEPGVEAAEGHPWEAHHVMHQGTYPHMRFDTDNVKPLALTVHKLDDRGELVGLLRKEMGDKAFFELQRRANIIKSVDLDKVEQDLRAKLSHSKRRGTYEARTMGSS